MSCWEIDGLLIDSMEQIGKIKKIRWLITIHPFLRVVKLFNIWTDPRTLPSSFKSDMIIIFSMKFEFVWVLRFPNEFMRTLFIQNWWYFACIVIFFENITFNSTENWQKFWMTSFNINKQHSFLIWTH